MITGLQHISGIVVRTPNYYQLFPKALNVLLDFSNVHTAFWVCHRVQKFAHLGVIWGMPLGGELAEKELWWAMWRAMMLCTDTCRSGTSSVSQVRRWWLATVGGGRRIGLFEYPLDQLLMMQLRELNAGRIPDYDGVLKDLPPLG
jgi:hypothetical protein